MSRPESKISCARAQVLVEPFLDGELSAARQASMQTHLRLCGDCAAACAAARTIQVSLRDMPAFEFPSARLAQLLDRTTRSSAGHSPAWQQRLAAAVAHTWDLMMGKNAARGGWLRPVAAVAAVTLVILVWVQQRQPEQSAVAQRVSQQELQQANEQARWALAYLARVTARAGDTALYRVGDVMGDVIGEHVFGTVTDAVGRSMQADPAAKVSDVLDKEVQTP